MCTKLLTDKGLPLKYPVTFNVPDEPNKIRTLKFHTAF